MKVKTSEAAGAVLDWAVAIAEGDENAKRLLAPRSKLGIRLWPKWEPSINGCQGGPLLEKYSISTECLWVCNSEKRFWMARIGSDYVQHGPTQLVAGMRCLVASRVGDEFEVPVLLTEHGISNARVSDESEE